VTFHKVSANFSSVAGGQVGRHAETAPDRVETSCFFDLHRKSGRLQMLGPVSATAAVGILVD
jgi:hypothetical protein